LSEAAETGLPSRPVSSDRAVKSGSSIAVAYGTTGADEAVSADD
jgi:hypothetical protein